MTRRTAIRRVMVIAWGVFGIAAVLGEAIVRLASTAAGELRSGLTAPEMFALAALAAIFIYGEGVCALHRRFVPSVVARSVSASESDRLVFAAFAPVYALSLIGAPARDVVRAGVGAIAIACAAVAVRLLPSPWRGIVDAAIASALAWGFVALIVHAAPALVQPIVARRARGYAATGAIQPRGAHREDRA
jgi:hypothetical protein